MKPKEFWLLGEDMISETCIVHFKKPEDEFLEYCIHVREIDPDREAAIQKMVGALEWGKMGSGEKYEQAVKPFLIEALEAWQKANK